MTDIKIISHPLIAHKLTLLRDVKTPTIQFRQLLREISMLLAFEVTRDLEVSPKPVETPLGPTIGSALSDKKIALVSILRAGNGLLDGMLDIIPSARVGFIGLSRDEATLKPAQYYVNLPDALDERLVILLDPMLATGNSANKSIARLKEAGAQNIRFLSLLAAPEGVKNVNDTHQDVALMTASLEERLNDIGYIVPGLGDAGDRFFGTK